METIRSWFSDPLFNPVINIATIIILALTAITGFLSIKRTSEANELSILPLLVIKFVGQAMKDRTIIIKNIGNGTAYDINIGRYVLIITDIQYLWELKARIKGVNVMEPGEKKKLLSTAFQNGKESDVKEFLIFHLDPEEEHEREPVGLFITFKNAKGIKYYEKIETGPDGLTIVIPPKRLNLYGSLIIWQSNFTTWFQLKYYKFLWRFKKPYITQPKKEIKEVSY